MVDSISRASAINVVYRKYPYNAEQNKCDEIVDALKTLPSTDKLTNVQNMHSGDSISRVDVMGAVQDHFNADGFKGYDDGQKMMDRIKALPSAEAEWIPCSERLPREDGKYLVYYSGAIIGERIDVMWYAEPLMPNVDAKGKHFYKSDSEWGDIIYDEVLAWMPLPEPYKEGSEV